ncbi:ABC transporter substrate-binding protein [Texcoconibacillus texcoconensis]|uniref:Multiple sugar transport system substrate-binding protein n=1 Tax=Texcoconibacillus texcoconensis TaxID=1095777 RepID=A0A840QRD0_9BACI|nr:extracellular solute-binding protein [Texcoconibacillus texcoconensis]MBB5173888.1 multiple sugar transport system substrate-binding protein [Texcoconibacillus texcoconensis]
MKRKLSLFMILLLSLMVLAMGCSADETSSDEGNESTNGETTQDAEPVSIQLAIEATGSIPEELQKQMDRFNEVNENIEVEVRTFSGGDSYNQAIMGQVAGGVAPDVFLIDGGHRIQMFSESDAILSLDDIVESEGVDLATFEESILNAFVVEDELFAIPKDYNTTALFYHKDLLEEKGLTAPETWDDLKEVASELTTEDQYGFGITPQINYFLPFVESTGLELVGPEGIMNENLKADEHVQSLELLETMFIEDESATSPQMVGAGWDGEMFANQQVAMVYGGSWIPGVLNDNPDLEVGVTPLPVSNTEASMLYTAGWAISSESKHPEAALELIEFLTSDEELVKGHDAGLIGLPPTTTAMEKLIDEKDDDPFLTVYSEVVEYGTPFGWIDPRFVDDYNQKLEELLYKPGERTITDILSDLE